VSEVLLPGGVHVLGAIPNSAVNLAGGFHLLEEVFPITVELRGEFGVVAPDPTIFAWAGRWVASAQRVWTSDGWFPSA
jgi:hypothetical protein